MGAWFASVAALVITYLIKDYLAVFGKYVLSKFTEYQANRNQSNKNEENLKKVEQSKDDSERHKNVEDLLNGN